MLYRIANLKPEKYNPSIAYNQNFYDEILDFGFVEEGDYIEFVTNNSILATSAKAKLQGWFDILGNKDLIVIE